MTVGVVAIETPQGTGYEIAVDGYHRFAVFKGLGVPCPRRSVRGDGGSDPETEILRWPSPGACPFLLEHGLIKGPSKR
jgi:hypothetical protein